MVPVPRNLEHIATRKNVKTSQKPRNEVQVQIQDVIIIAHLLGALCTHGAVESTRTPLELPAGSCLGNKRAMTKKVLRRLQTAIMPFGAQETSRHPSSLSKV